MQNTTNLNLKKPDQTDYVNIVDLNDNMDVLDEVVQEVLTRVKGLNKVENTSDLDKPISTAMQKALGEIEDEVVGHKADLVSHGVYGIATGTNELELIISNVTAYVEGMLVAFKNTISSTAATTLNINALGAKAIIKANGTGVDNLKANAIYQLRYNGVNFTLLGEGGEYGTATASEVLLDKTFGTEEGLKVGTLDLTNLMSNNVRNGISINGIIGGLDPLELSVGDTEVLFSTTKEYFSPETSSSPTKMIEVLIMYSGTIRCFMDINVNGSSPDPVTNNKGYIYINNKKVFEHQAGSSSITYTDDITVKKGDLVQFFVSSSWLPSFNIYMTTKMRNCKISISSVQKAKVNIS